MFYIKKLSITTNDKISQLSFIPGVNIVFGPSNTGKSLIVECINYLLGAKKNNFDSKLNIQKVAMTVNVGGKDLYVSREIDSSKFEVGGNVEGITSGSYVLGKGKNCIFKVWLKIMGIPYGTKIYSTQARKIQQLTLRTFYHIFLISEDRVHDKAPILIAPRSMGIATLCALLFLGTGNNYITNESSKDLRIKKAQNQSIVSLVNRGFSFLEQEKSRVNQDGLLLDVDELKHEIDRTLNEIGAAEGTLKDTLDSCRIIGEKISDLFDRLAEDEVLMNRNEHLLSQYKSDIQRLTFVVEGSNVTDQAKILDKCPFCDTVLVQKAKKHPSKGFIESAVIEEREIEKQVNDVLSVQRSLLEEHQGLKREIQEKSTIRQQLDEKIRCELEPQIKRLKEQLDVYQEALKTAEVNNMIGKFSKFLNGERKNAEAQDVETVFKAKDKFKEVFEEPLNEELGRLLKCCEYQDYVNSYFNFKDLDVVVNGHSKRSQGKGFRAFLNTIVAMAIQNCIAKMGKYQPSLFIVDSPILSLKEKDSAESIRISGPMKKHLFQYFMDRNPSPQSIIIDNEIPDIDYKDANLIQFTKEKGNGRYGLIDGYYD